VFVFRRGCGVGCKGHKSIKSNTTRDSTSPKQKTKTQSHAVYRDLGMRPVIASVRLYKNQTKCTILCRIAKVADHQAKISPFSCAYCAVDPCESVRYNAMANRNIIENNVLMQKGHKYANGLSTRKLNCSAQTPYMTSTTSRPSRERSHGTGSENAKNDIMEL